MKKFKINDIVMVVKIIPSDSERSNQEELENSEAYIGKIGEIININNDLKYNIKVSFSSVYNSNYFEEEELLKIGRVND